MDRRTFVSWVGLGWIASCLPIAIAACSSNQKTTTQSSPSLEPPQADGFQKVGTIADLDKDGQIFAKEFVGGAVIVVRDPSKPNTVSAVSPTCTHKGCIIEWKADQKQFVCPCHSAKFSPTGQVVEAPAERPLKVFTAKIENDSVLVKA